MTVIELPSANGVDLFVHSPVHLDEPLRQALDKIGTVKHVVSPNYEHVKYAKEWQEAFPEANMWACPTVDRQGAQLTKVRCKGQDFFFSSFARGSSC